MAKRKSIVDQVRTSFGKVNRLAMALGVPFGAFVPIACFVLAHFEVNAASWWSDPKSALVLGGLIYSAKTVFLWGKQAFANDGAKALGYVILLEGVMVFSGTWWLCGFALLILMTINAVATTATLAGLTTPDNK